MVEGSNLKLADTLFVFDLPNGYGEHLDAFITRNIQICAYADSRTISNRHRCVVDTVTALKRMSERRTQS